MRVRMDLHDIQRATIRILLIVSAWLIGVSVLGSARHFLFLILLAWLVAIAAEPAIRWFVSRGTSRGLATAIVGGTSLLILVGLFVLFGTTAFQQAGQLVSQGPAVVERVAAQLNETFGLTIDPATITSSLQLEATDVQKFAEDLGGGVIGVFGSLASVLFDLITVIVFSFYIAGAGPGLVRRLAVWMPHERQLVLGELWQIATEKTGGYVASKVVLSAISSFFYGVFFYFVDLPGWLPLALLVGLTAQFIPLVGTYIGIAVPIVVALAAEPITALWILIFSVIYQQIETYVFTPHVSQRTMDVNPAVALAAVFLGAAIWGPIGAIIGVPIAAVVVALLDVYGPEHPLAPEIRATGDHGIPSATAAAARRRRRFSRPAFGSHPVRKRNR
jgi:predicted PurR-regulated permease PerM